MRQRTTFLHKPEDGVDPASFKVTDTSLTGPELSSVREDRATLALEELPDELRQVLQRCHELHIRWVTANPHETLSPLVSRLPPGFHLFYTPQPEHHEQSLNDAQLCTALKKAFGPLDCDTPQTSFTTLPNDRFSHATAYQYFTPLSSLSPFTSYIQTVLCGSSRTDDPVCADAAHHVANAVSLDVSYDTISHALKVTTTSTLQSHPIAAQASPNHRVEVGVLAASPAQQGVEPGEIGMAGVLTVLGQDKKPSPTMFKFPARHRHFDSSKASFAMRIIEPAGLHPTFHLDLRTPPPPAESTSGEECALHAYFTFPKAVFPDRYQLADPLFLASKNLTALRYASTPIDLEAPEYAVGLWGSTALLELSQDSATAEVPLHLRYRAPAPGGQSALAVPYPAVFWACTSEDGTKFPASPFERVNLGYDGLFGPRTVFWHVDPVAPGGAMEKGAAGSLLTVDVPVPVLDIDKSGWIGLATAVVVMAGFGWIAWKLLGVYLRTGYGPQEQMKGLQEKKKQ